MTATEKVSVVLLAALLGGCVGPRGMTWEQTRKQLQPKLHTLVIEDGVDRNEAQTIAEAYFFKFNPNQNGALSPVTDSGDSWTASTGIGNTIITNFFSRTAPLTETQEPIRIEKKTGRVTWSDGPTVDNPRAIAD